MLLQVFEPSGNSDTLSLWLGIVIAIILLALTIWLLKRKVTREQYNRNLLMAMLCFFGFLIAASTAFFSGWNMRKLGVVEITESFIRIGQDNFPRQALGEVRIVTDKANSFVNPAINLRTTRLLLLEHEGGKTYALPDDQYDIQGIMRALQQTK